MTLDDMIREAASRGLSKLNLFQRPDGRWQANALRAGSDGWRVEHAADPADALRLVLSVPSEMATDTPNHEEGIFG